MRNLIIAAASVAFLASAGSAFAAEQLVGTVANVNAAAGTLSLASGETFKLDNGAVLSSFAPGQEIGVSYQGNQVLGVYNPHPANPDNSDNR